MWLKRKISPENVREKAVQRLMNLVQITLQKSQSWSLSNRKQANSFQVLKKPQKLNYHDNHGPYMMVQLHCQCRKPMKLWRRGEKFKKGISTHPKKLNFPSDLNLPKPYPQTNLWVLATSEQEFSSPKGWGRERLEWKWTTNPSNSTEEVMNTLCKSTATFILWEETFMLTKEGMDYGSISPSWLSHRRYKNPSLGAKKERHTWFYFPKLFFSFLGLSWMMCSQVLSNHERKLNPLRKYFFQRRLNSVSSFIKRKLPGT